MNRIWKKLGLVLCAVLIMGTFVFPVSAAETRVTGGSSRGNAKVIDINKDYITTIGSSQDYSIFKFKTYSYRAYYELRLTNVSVARPINIYLRGTDRLDAGTALDTKNLTKGNDCYIHTYKKSLKENSWYYVIIKNTNRSSGKVKFKVWGAEDLEGNTMTAAKSVEVGKNYYGKHTYPVDGDYFRFVPESSGNYRVVVKNMSQVGWIRSRVVNGSNTMLKKKDYYPTGDYMSAVVSLSKGRAYFIHIQTGDEEWSDPDCRYKLFIQKR